jgi:putative flippase GtrA
LDHRAEGRLAALYTLTAGAGFLTDAAILKGLMALGAPAAVARAASLFCAMQVTFWINGALVFKRLEKGRVLGQWARYMGTNGFGNLCNYFAFVTLISLHWPFWSNRWTALIVGSFTAWVINYSCTRLFVFNKASSARSPAAPGAAVEGADPAPATPLGR